MKEHRGMDAYLAMTLAAFACSLLLMLPLALRSEAVVLEARDTAWRDRLPLFLRVLRPALRWYAPAVDASLRAHKREIVQSQLNAAGASYLISPAEFVVLQRLALATGVVIVPCAILVLQVRDPIYIAGTAALAPLAFLYPDLRLRELTKRRQSRFEKEFPFFLDVLVLAMKAGLNFTAAVEQAIAQLSDGPVRQEFSRYLREARTGVARRVALERLAGRVMLPAVANFSSAVIQAEQTGGALGEVLSDQARQRRSERFLRAEKLANQAPVKMLFPLIALLFPVTFIIIGFPIAMQLIEAGAMSLF
jgi:tight adherence protein C